MLYFFTPFSFEKKLFEAYDRYISLLPNNNDWACITDGDTAFLLADFGFHIQEYINKYPETELFTCYASRCFYTYQVPNQVNQQNDSIRYHYQQAVTHHTHQYLEIKDLHSPIAGHLFVIKKSTWLAIRENVKRICLHETIEGVDTAISNAIIARKQPIRLMKGIYLLHYFRLVGGVDNKKHLGYGNRLNIITPCARPENLHRVAESIKLPRTSYTWWIVIDKPAGTVDASLLPRNAKILYYSHPESIAGHAQRNYALHFINDGLVFFLDDDTLLHEELYDAVGRLTNDFIHFDQAHPDGTKRIGGTVEVNHIDTGSAVVSRQLIGDTRFKIKLYNADGYFWKAISQKAQRSFYIPKILSWYNKIENNISNKQIDDVNKTHTANTDGNIIAEKKQTPASKTGQDTYVPNGREPVCGKNTLKRKNEIRKHVRESIKNHKK